MELQDWIYALDVEVDLKVENTLFISTPHVSAATAGWQWRLTSILPVVLCRALTGESPARYWGVAASGELE
jgi:hypothetical protein